MAAQTQEFENFHRVYGEAKNVQEEVAEEDLLMKTFEEGEYIITSKVHKHQFFDEELENEDAEAFD